eukprot:TRINITY_DN22861_c0_g1_i1.p1 TRINITY_DN22861_c0_g1~~TRINITY_DN22861_c0_g1_i1.p1  ORF type:complete len:160 (+),score=27.05 TRINITY_DN22861_c0_g1_i1:51-530(+)
MADAPANAIEAQLVKLGITVPPAPVPGGNFVPFTQTGNLVYVSGQIPKYEDGTVVTGTLGDDLDVAAGQKAAKLASLNLISQMKAACGGDLSKIKKIVKVEGFVRATPDFGAHPKVINGCSDLLVEVFGKEVGMHTRFAVGVTSLPLNVPVEICIIFEV